jgi:hypothetical protein
MPQVTLEEAQAAKQAVRRRFETLGKVVAVGITRVRGEYAVKVNLSEPLEAGIKLPTEIDGVSVQVEITGSIRAR